MLDTLTVMHSLAGAAEAHAEKVEFVPEIAMLKVNIF